MIFNFVIFSFSIFIRLNDESYLVRICALKVLTNLVLSDMIKVKGHVSEIARCIVDDNCKLQEIARRFFNDLSKKVCLFLFLLELVEFFLNFKFKSILQWLILLKLKSYVYYWRFGFNCEELIKSWLSWQ